MVVAAVVLVPFLMVSDGEVTPANSEAPSAYTAAKLAAAPVLTREVQDGEGSGAAARWSTATLHAGCERPSGATPASLTHLLPRSRSAWLRSLRSSLPLPPCPLCLPRMSIAFVAFAPSAGASMRTSDVLLLMPCRCSETDQNTGAVRHHAIG